MTLERVRHVKRRTEYEVLGEAEAQSSNGVRHFVDGRNVTVYQCLKTGKLWVRFTDEFRDGRFETIASAPSPDQSGVGGDLGACLTAPGSSPSGDAPGGSSSQATAIPSRGPAPIARRIIYFGQPGVVICDARCDKAWGINHRPQVQFSDDPDDTAFLSDAELGEAPADPGTYEGGCAKPTEPSERLNKWCVRECERSAMSKSGRGDEVVEARDFSCRLYNQPWKHADALAGEAAQAAETQSGSVHEHAADLSATPKVNPNSPSPPPHPDPKTEARKVLEEKTGMTVEEARQLLEGVRDPVRLAKNFRAVDNLEDAERIESALLTLQSDRGDLE
jgi:hypothetical protein